MQNLMIHYDRTVGVFGPSDEMASTVDLEICQILNDGLTQVREWLNLKRHNGKFSHGFMIQLTIGSVSRQLHVHNIYDEIGKLEGTDLIPSRTKNPQKMQPPLAGLWHKHYFHAGFMVRNLMDEANRMVKDGRWEKMFSPHYGKYMHEIANQVSYEIVMGAYQRRAQDRRLTGGFIVYEKQADGSNYYLTLGAHGEWAAIRARVDEYREFDAGDSS